jgi:metal-responsive CopG/Arc/MetJ family transcriptional regulator
MLCLFIGSEPSMRSVVQDTVAKFRVNGGLMARADAKAQREGMTRSELFRQALRREVGEVA